MEVSEIAKELGMSPGAVRKAIARGTMRASVAEYTTRGSGSLRGHYVVDRDEVERYKREHRTSRLAERAKQEESG